MERRKEESIELTVTVEAYQPAVGGGRIRLTESILLPSALSLLEAAQVL